MKSPEVPVNRALVGLLAVVCGLLGTVMWLISDTGGADMWPGAFIRTGLLLAAFWLALPTPRREAAWARVSIWQVVGVLAAIVVVIRTRIPLKVLIPFGLAAMAALMVLRPPRKARPSRRG